MVSQETCRNSVEEPSEGNPEAHNAQFYKAKRGKSNLGNLSNELLIMITDFLSAGQPWKIWRFANRNPSSDELRIRGLVGMSTANRRLRSIVLPKLYERLQIDSTAVGISTQGSNPQLELAAMKNLVQNPNISYVRHLQLVLRSVCFSQSSDHLPPLGEYHTGFTSKLAARLLGQVGQNLETLGLYFHTLPDDFDHFERELDENNVTFPKMKNLFLGNAGLYFLIHRCPNLESLEDSLNALDSDIRRKSSVKGDRRLFLLAPACKGLRSLTLHKLYPNTMLLDVVANIPSLRTLSLVRAPDLPWTDLASLDDLGPILRRLPHLEELRIPGWLDVGKEGFERIQQHPSEVWRQKEANRILLEAAETMFEVLTMLDRLYLRWSNPFQWALVTRDWARQKRHHALHASDAYAAYIWDDWSLPLDWGNDGFIEVGVDFFYD